MFTRVWPSVGKDSAEAPTGTLCSPLSIQFSKNRVVVGESTFFLCLSPRRTWARISVTGMFFLLSKPDCSESVGGFRRACHVQRCHLFLGPGAQFAGFYHLSGPPVPHIEGEGWRSKLTCTHEALRIDRPAGRLMLPPCAEGIVRNKFIKACSKPGRTQFWGWW